MSVIVYRVPEMNTVQVRRNLIYKKKNGKDYYFDICYPIGYDNTKVYPTVTLISGGSGSSLKLNDNFREGLLSWGKLLAASGLLTIHFIWNYKTPNDIIDLICYLRTNSTELNIDRNYMSVFSFSRGVKLSLDKVLSINNGFLKSIVVYYGKISDSIKAKQMENLPPLLIAMAGNDKFFSLDCNDIFIEKNKGKTEIQKLVHPNGEHAFDIRNNDEKSIEIIKQTLDFLTKTLENRQQ